MTTNTFHALCLKICSVFLLLIATLCFTTAPVVAQNLNNDGIQPLRSDVGINGLTANFHFLSDFNYLKSDSLIAADSLLEKDGSSELEFVFRDVRMLNSRIGVGFQVLTSFFVDSPNASFGIGSWGLGPVIRAYPFETERFQPYFQANAMMGNNLAVSTLANTNDRGNGFRVRLGLRGGAAIRLTNGFGIFIEGGPDWESGRLFKADALAWQLNIGIDVYRFN